jgi:UDP-3-O-[3-hydroxymyristoyl] glucosamine N-acyltransferase
MSDNSAPLHSDRTFSVGEILSGLSEIGIGFEFSGDTAENSLRFSSLFRPRDKGIYFVDGEIPKLTEIAGAIFIAAASSAATSQVIVVSHPQVAYYKLMQHFFGKAPSAGVHHTAIVDPLADIHPSAHIGPYCVVEGGSIGENTVLSSHVVVMHGTTIGSNVTVESHSTIGATGVAWAWCPLTEERVSQPQIGGTRIGNSVFIGTDVTIVRGSINEITSIGAGTVIAHGSKIGHGARIGNNSHFANNVSIAGNVTLGEKCFLGAASVIRPKITLADKTIVGAGAVVVKDQSAPSQVLQGVPATVAKPKRQLSGVPKSTK